ncbi:hypothetical protein L6452_31287 [Arctium lappa]|uniref:Uncharacterized protein n=1 Tax=Arctium lappa TaxID=4217 RepID=A0ACB8ZLH6_ARCLA|nr:hypothetical protein L6452_31287 [Arctium lappa]
MLEPSVVSGGSFVSILDENGFRYAWGDIARDCDRGHYRGAHSSGLYRGVVVSRDSALAIVTNVTITSHNRQDHTEGVLCSSDCAKRESFLVVGHVGIEETTLGSDGRDEDDEPHDAIHE